MFFISLTGFHIIEGLTATMTDGVARLQSTYIIRQKKALCRQKIQV